MKEAAFLYNNAQMYNQASFAFSATDGTVHVTIYSTPPNFQRVQSQHTFFLENVSMHVYLAIG